MKKILILDLNGTSSVYTHYLSNGLKSKEIKVEILGQKKNEFLDVFIKHNEYLGFKFGVKLLDYLLNWLWLLANYNRYDLVIVQWLQLLKYSSLEINLISYLQRRINLIYIVHNIYPHNSENLKVNKRYNLLYKKLKNIVVHTNRVEKSIKEITHKANIIKFEHGLFFKDFRIENRIENNCRCLLVGYISKYKGVEDALKVVKILKNKEIYVSLEIIGYGEKEYIKMLCNLIEEYGISDNVKILSKEVSTRFLIEKITKASMLWLPYNSISQSGVAYTSMGLGVPFVGYDVGNFKESFGVKGFAEVVEKGNLEDFCLMVEKILDNNVIYREKISNELKDDGWVNNRTIVKKIF